MKKLLSFMLAATMVLTFVSCGDKNKDDDEVKLANTSWKTTVNVPLPLDDSVLQRMPITPTLDLNMYLNFIDGQKGIMKANASLPSSLGAFASIIEQYLGSYLDEFKLEENFTYTFDGVSKGEIITKDTDEEEGTTTENRQAFTYNSSSKTIEIAVDDDEMAEMFGTKKLTLTQQ